MSNNGYFFFIEHDFIARLVVTTKHARFINS